MDVATAVAVVGLALAWLLYRLERAATRRREIDAARAVLLGVKRGMVDGLGDEPGWGDRYFARNWSEEEAQKRAAEDVRALMDRKYSQVLRVPTAPLEALIGSGAAGDLVSEETIFLANIGLWHLDVFNQLVQQQTDMLARHLPDIVDEQTDARRRYALAEAIGSHGRLLHRRGVGEPYGPDGWYRRLRDAVDADIARLDRERHARLYPLGESRLAIGDALAVASVAAVIVVAAVHATRSSDNTPPPLPPAATTTTTTTP